MKMKNNTTIKINKFMLIGIIFLFVAIIVKMGFVVIAEKTDGTNLTEFASKRNTAKQILYAPRGNIYDNRGELLARNVNSYTVIAYLNEKRTTDKDNPQHVVDKEMTAEALEPILSKLSSKMTQEYIFELLMTASNKKSYQVELGPGGRDISEVVKNEIIKLDLPGIDFIPSSKRYYPMDNFASYLIGYAKKNEKGEIVGEMGIEGYFNDVLKGTNGYSEYQRDAYGYQIPNTKPEVKESVSGQDVYLTIDNNIQLILEDAVRDFKDNFSMDWITITIADAKTGAILGSATDPNFNLNTLNITSYVNPLVGYQYEPGSTMKIYSWMAAMENGLYDGNKTYKSGSIKVGNDTVFDVNKDGWGTISFNEGFYRSSNVAATTLAGKLGREKLRNFYDILGFGTKTGIELPGEVIGKTNFVYDIEVATASFGQGVMTTPIQNIQALTALANEGIMIKPYIIAKIVAPDGTITYEGAREEVRVVAKKETVKQVRDLMYGVVNLGLTEARYAIPKNVTLIGKTGTAEMAGKDGKYLSGKYDVIKSFSGLFPYENPEYIIYFSSQRIVSSSKEMFERIASIVDAIATKDISINENIAEATKTINVNNYLSKNTKETEESLWRLGLVPIILGNGEKIINQYPPKSSVVVEDTKIFLLTNNKEYVMPDVIGWSSNDIITFCNFIGLKYKTEGYGKVKAINIEKGSNIEPNSTLAITLE